MFLVDTNPLEMLKISTMNRFHLVFRNLRPLGLDRDARTAMAAASMRTGDKDPDGNGWH